MSGIRLIWSVCVLLLLSGCGREADRQDFEQVRKALEHHNSTQAVLPEQPAGATTEIEEPPAHSTAGTSDAGPAQAIFEKRILPIFQAARPSSCSECHLSGVDLKDYIRPTQAETFASLVAVGLVDVTAPDDSKLLQFISRSPEKPSLISKQIREEEFEAFRAWIRTAVAEPELLQANVPSAPIGPQIPDEVIRHARKDRVLASFLDNVWTEVGRCAGCHSPDRNQKQVKENGEQVSWIKLNDPEATLSHMVENELINPDDPLKSLLLMKPTMQVDHGGGQKMVIGDRTYKQFRRFIDDYSAVARGAYTRAEQLPVPHSEVSVVTDIWLKIEGVPARFDKLLLQVDLFRATGNGWSESRVATSDRLVFGPKNLWQHSLSLTAPRDSKHAAGINSKRIAPGRYLLRILVDQKKKLQQDVTAELGDEDLVAEVEVESRWPAGYGRMTVVKFPAE